jgi:tRNA A-37 threonylcarbamoyl transferase component Bud32
VQASLEDGTGSTTVLQHLAVRSLASLAVKSSHAAEINKQGGMPVLVELLIHSQYLADNSLAILRNATRALANLSSCAQQGTWQREAIARSVLAARALQPLLVLTLHQDTEVVRHTARVLAELSSVCVAPDLDDGSQDGHSWSSAQGDSEADGMTPRSSNSQLSFGTVDTQSVASSTSSVSNLSPYRSYRCQSSTMVRRSSGNMQPQIIQECDGVEWLCILSSHNDWVVKRSAALIFERLSAAAHAWLAERTAGIVPAVMSLAGEDDRVTRQHAKFALAALSKYEAFQTRIVTEQQLGPILMQRDGDGVPDKRLTSVILRYLTASDECRQALIQQAGVNESGRSIIIEEILRLMIIDDPEIKSNLAYVIVDVSLDRDNLQMLCNPEVLNFIIDLARAEDETMQTNAAVAMSNMAAYQPAKELLGELGIVPVLIKLVGSQNADITKHAVIAMDHLSKDGPLDLPLGSPRKADQMVRVVIGQAAHLIQVDAVRDGLLMDYNKLLSCIEIELDAVVANYDIVYLDSEHKAMTISDQESLNKVLKFRDAEALDTHKSLTLYLSVRDVPVGQLPGLDTSSFAADSGIGGIPGQDKKFDGQDIRLPIDTLLEVQEDQLDFCDRIGVGACGEVFHGHWRGVDVAIKCLFTDTSDERELTKDFRNEVRMMMQLRHPNICLFMGAVINQTKPRLCIISEFCHRGSLYRILHKSEKPIPWLRRVNMALDAAKGCHFLHTHEPCIVHRDLKSPNLVVDKHWTLKVCDFGLAMTKSHFYVSMGAGGVGTPEWTAPEVLKDEPFNEKADVYSFGVILWELCTRKRPFRGLTQMQVVVAVGFNGERLPPVNKPDVDPALNELMMKCMAEKWADRPAFDLVVQTLQKIAKHYEEKEKQRAASRRSARGSSSDAGREAKKKQAEARQMSVEQAQGGIGQWLELRSEGMGHLASDLAVAFTTAGYQVRFTEPKQIISPYTPNIHFFVRPYNRM